MIVNNSYRQNNINFGASEKETAELVQKWIDKKRPDKLVLMLTRDDFPTPVKRSWADFKAYWLDKENSQTCFFREFNKKYHYFGIGRCAILTQTPVVRPELFQKALNAAIKLMAPSSGVQEVHKTAAKEFYQKHSTPLEHRLMRKIPLLESVFHTKDPK